MARSPKWKTQKLWQQKYQKPKKTVTGPSMGIAPSSLPGGTTRIVAKGNGVAMAYGPQGQFLGVVRADLAPDVEVSYDGNGTPTGIKTPGDSNAGSGGSAGGDSAPAPPAGPKPIPEDETYTASAALRGRTYDTSIGNIRDAENQSALSYGLSFARNDQDQIDPTSIKMPSFSADSDGFDPANPFSRASLLNRSYFTGNNIATGSYANRGLLNSGAYQRSLQRNTLGYQQGTDSLLKDFASRLAEYKQQRSDAATTRDLDLNNDRRDLLSRIAAQREY